MCQGPKAPRSGVRGRFGASLLPLLLLDLGYLLLVVLLSHFSLTLRWHIYARHIVIAAFVLA